MTFTALLAPSTSLNQNPPPSAALFRAFGGPFGDVLDAADGGLRKVSGNTKNKGSPDYAVRRRVRLHDQLSGRLIREQWSQEGSGGYLFDRIRVGLFYVVSFDHTGLFNGVIATSVASEPM